MTIALLTASLLAGLAPAAAHAEPASGYMYTYEREAVPAPLPYLSEGGIRGEDVGLTKFVTPEDLTIENGTIYVADTGNNRIVSFRAGEKTARVIDAFDRNGETDGFNKPEGIFADADNGHLYIADTGNRRIVQLNAADGSFVKVVEAPQSSILRASFQFTPTKVALDKANRMYVISKSAYEGIMEFDADGEFVGFVGTNRVKFNPVDLLWKRISTKEQRGQMVQFVPLEFNNMNIDDEGFMYTTTSEVNSDEPIKRLNPSGIDILRREGYIPPKGDIDVLEVGSIPGSSTFVAVNADEAGIYYGLDSKRGRIFTYDKDGNLLFQFGGVGNGAGRFRAPVTLDHQEESIYVLDKEQGQISVFEPTPYGSAIRDAVIAQYNGDAAGAEAKWREVLRLNHNNEIAYIGIGKALLKKGDNKEAMAYFKLGNNRTYYSEAFKRHREEWIERNFGYMAGLILLLLIAALGLRKWAKERAKQPFAETEEQIWRNPFYTLTHPFQGFWEMKFEGKGRLSIAIGLVLTLVLVLILKQQYSGFVVNFNDPDDLNSITQLRFVALPFVLWVVANWSLTTLMEGEGKFREIVMVTGYALLPLIIVYLPQILISHAITAQESSFYYLLDSIAMIWFVFLLFVGTMTVHQYTPGKTVVTMLLTLVVIGIILFLALLLFSVLQQMTAFIASLYQEIMFRL